MEAIALRLMDGTQGFFQFFFRRLPSGRALVLIYMIVGAFFGAGCTPKRLLREITATDPVPYYSAFLNLGMILGFAFIGAAVAFVLSASAAIFWEKVDDFCLSKARSRKKIEQAGKYLGLDSIALLWLIWSLPGRHLWLDSELLKTHPKSKELQGLLAVLSHHSCVNLATENKLFPASQLIRVDIEPNDGYALIQYIRRAEFHKSLKPQLERLHANIEGVALITQLLPPDTRR